MLQVFRLVLHSSARHPICKKRSQCRSVLRVRLQGLPQRLATSGLGYRRQTGRMRSTLGFTGADHPPRCAASRQAADRRGLLTPGVVPFGIVAG